MADPFEEVLRLVSEGRLTAAEAAPILDALGASETAQAEGEAAVDQASRMTSDEPDGAGHGTATSIRIEITENGRKIVNLRIPVALGRMALDRIPGLSGSNADLVRLALAEGRSGTLLHIDEEGDGVRIALE
jgi:hypothetical protein